MKIATVTGALAFVLSAAAAPGANSPPRNGDGKCPCPANAVQPNGSLGKSFVSTSLLVPIAKSKPNYAYPATKWAQVTPNDVCTVFNLDLPVAQTQGKVCNLVFDFPSKESAPNKFTFKGPGTFKFTGYAIGAGAVAGQTTYNRQPAPGPSPPNPPPTMTPGHSYIINSAPCGIPATVPGSVTVSGSLCSPDTTFSFYQSNDGCPLGFFVVLTDV
ncbi:GPI anchored cell wall protein [Colletotrichum incanum]|nr:GPI anchored cell wall protein [Colletotrichum incanum]